MFGMFKTQTPRCPVCGKKMENVEYYEVPPGAKREFARMNRYKMLSKAGWYNCRECEIHIHKQTIEYQRTFDKNKPFGK